MLSVLFVLMGLNSPVLSASPREEWAIQDSRGRIGAGSTLFKSKAACERAMSRNLAAAGLRPFGDKCANVYRVG
jgi:hypothetical protein